MKSWVTEDKGGVWEWFWLSDPSFPMEVLGLLIISDIRNFFCVRVVKPCNRLPSLEILKKCILWLSGADLVVGLGFKALFQPC